MTINRVIDIASGRAGRSRLSILIFHRVLATADELFPEQLSAPRFDELVRHIRRRFNVLTLRDAVDMLKHGSLPTRSIALTFDDGYADNLSVAAPILHHHGVPATVFVATSFLDGGCMWNDVVIEACRRARSPILDLTSIGLGCHAIENATDRRRLVEDLLSRLKYEPLDRREMTARKVAAIAEIPIPTDLMLTSGMLCNFERYGMDVGAHTRRHPILANVTQEIAWTEIHEGRKDLEDILGRSPLLFAYPNGAPNRDFSSEHARMVREAGFSAAVTTAWGAASQNSDLFQLPRFTPWHYQPLRFDLLMWRNMLRGPESRALPPNVG